MKTIYKFTLNVGRPSTWDVDIGGIGKVLLVGNQSGRAEEVQVWIEADTDLATVTRRFEVVGTGHTVRKGLAHVGSVIAPPYVWHVYEDTVADREEI